MADPAPKTFTEHEVHGFLDRIAPGAMAVIHAAIAHLPSRQANAIAADVDAAIRAETERLKAEVSSAT